MALDSQSEIARGGGTQPVWVTGPEARAHGQLLRARHDAILVGAGTVRADDPELTCRLPGLADRSPVRVILSKDLALPPSSKLAQTANKVPVWLVGAAGAAHNEELAVKGVEFVDAALVQNKLWLPSVMEALVARGITRLLVEGGPGMWLAFAEASLVDEVVLYVAPAQHGRTDDEDRARKALQRWIGPMPLDLAERRNIGPDTMWRFRRAALKEGI
jgi:diaminohydroxyphosphoribosylaminopyrimidine deaminase/5-amino-6-(5-phosphoribosylamino)uracil reductase